MANCGGLVLPAIPVVTGLWLSRLPKMRSIVLVSEQVAMSLPLLLTFVSAVSRKLQHFFLTEKGSRFLVNRQVQATVPIQFPKRGKRGREKPPASFLPAAGP